jgi:hypothetical protein
VIPHDHDDDGSSNDDRAGDDHVPPELVLYLISVLLAHDRHLLRSPPPYEWSDSLAPAFLVGTPANQGQTTLGWSASGALVGPIAQRRRMSDYAQGVGRQMVRTRLWARRRPERST